MKCGKCRWYYPEIIWMEGDSESWRKWGGCNNPKLDIDGNIIRAGGEDGYGDYWHMAADFGCILFENK
jgi:hypothetical protein